MFNQTRTQKHSRTGTHADVERRDLKSSGHFAAVLFTALIAVLPLTASGQARSAPITKSDFAFVNVVDDTQGFSSFGFAPAINNAGAVAFQSTGSDFILGSVWKWQNGTLTLIATSKNEILGLFGDNVVINSAGSVGFNAKVLSGNDVIIATGDGGPLNIIASANQQGLVGGQFFGISAMNDSGTVVFLGVRKDLHSRAIFAGRGGPLTTIVDTATNSNFDRLGNSAINASGKVVFLGFLPDRTDGIFLSNDTGIKDIADANNPSSFDFLDPVISDSGLVGGAAFLNNGGVEVFTGTAAGITPRTDPNGSFFTFVDNVSINNLGDVAFSAAESSGREGIFVELTGGANPVPVIEEGDSLFGSTVVGLSLGRFSSNDRGQVVFHYQLADGRAGIAVAFRQH